MAASSDKTLVMVLCGGRGERLYPLTKDRAKPSVPFLGSYRIIDFGLSNALNSGLRRIALLTQYKSLSLERHILNGWHIFNPESGEFIISLSAQGRISDHWYEGTADAVFQNLYTIQQENPGLVLILSGDHIYRADYMKMIDAMAEQDADALIMTKQVPAAEASRFGVMAVDGESRIFGFSEKPKKPVPVPWNPDICLVSMGVYLFKTPVLVRALMPDARSSSSSHDFGRDILPGLFKRLRIMSYEFQGYWEDIGTIDAYWKANMDFLSAPPPFDVGDPVWPFRTCKPQFPPSRISGGVIQRSVIGDGCDIGNARIVGSVLSPGVTVEEGAEISDSIIFGRTVIRKNARLDKVIVDKNCVVPAGFGIGLDRDKDLANFKISRAGVRVVPKGWCLE